MEDYKAKPDSYWKEILSAEEYKVCRKKGTEKPFQNKYNDNKESGSYKCKCCTTPLFLSDHKFDSGTGWPSFFQPATEESILFEEDNSLFRKRTEVLCRNCSSHLGHVFSDGPQPTGQRFCINSVSLDFEKDKKENK